MAASAFCISMSALVKSILRLRIVLDPLKQISADLNKAKEVLALISEEMTEIAYLIHVVYFKIQQIKIVPCRRYLALMLLSNKPPSTSEMLPATSKKLNPTSRAIASFAGMSLEKGAPRVIYRRTCQHYVNEHYIMSTLCKRKFIA